MRPMTPGADEKDLQRLGLSFDARTVALMQGSRDCIKLMSADGILTYLSHNGRCVLGIEDLDSVRGRPWADLWPEDARHLIHGAVKAAAAGRMASFVADCPTAPGDVLRWEVTVCASSDTDSNVTEIMAISRVTRDELRGLSIL